MVIRLSKLQTSLFTLIVSALCVATGFAQTGPEMVQLADNVPAALVHASYVGHHNPASMLNVMVALKLRNTEQLHEFLQAVQDPTSSVYHQFLTPRQFNSMYGPTSAQTEAVVAYLKSRGLNVTNVTPDGRLILVRDQSAKVEEAFGVLVNDFSYHGRRVFGTMDNPQFPANIASSVQAVLGLSNVIRFHPMLVHSAVQPFAESSPSGYSPQQIATAYNWPSITNTGNGNGTTIAIVEFNSAGLSSGDYTYFWSYYGLPSHTVNVFSNIDGAPGSVTDDDREAALDVERAGAMAPGATLNVYDGAYGPGSNTFYEAMVDVLRTVVNAETAQLMTISYGLSESTWPTGTQGGSYKTADGYFDQAAAVGISAFVASGDDGTSAGANDPDYPSSDPYVVATGGTTLTLNGNNTIASETAWSGSGGAKSMFFTTEPSWQAGNGVPQNGVRDTSDVSMDADPNTPYSLYFQGGWQCCWGGTSFVAPQFAALFADAISSASGKSLGQADPAIYADADSNNYSTDFHDITSGSNGAFSAGLGWDHPTGWGSVNASELLTHIEETVTAPQDLSAEYETCNNGSDQYLVSWEAPATGVVTGYDAQWDEPNLGIGWESIPGGGLVRTLKGVHPSTVVNLRVRASNGFVWSPYATYNFTSSVCRPPQ